MELLTLVVDRILHSAPSRWGLEKVGGCRLAILDMRVGCQF